MILILRIKSYRVDGNRGTADAGTCVSAAGCTTGPDAYDGATYQMATYGTAVGSTIVQDSTINI